MWPKDRGSGMSFETRSGTHGARQPGGRLLTWMNRLMMRRIRNGKGTVGGIGTLVLTTVGRKSGVERQTPVTWFPHEDGGWLIVAAAAGGPANPAWYLNLAAHPDRLRVELGRESTPVHAEQLHGDRRARAWQGIAAASARFADYQTKTDRELPVILLTPRAA
jgi:deazaflavin-dependent oxidoreductase (nitroreductase family)